MIADRHWIRTGVLIGGALIAAAVLAQTPPATAPRDNTGDESATAQRECQQMTGVDRQNCMRRRQTDHDQTNPSTSSTTRPPPSTSMERTQPAPAAEPRSQDRAPGPSSTTDQANSSTRDATTTDASGNRTRMSQKDTDTSAGAKDPNRRFRGSSPPADEEDESSPSSDQQRTPPPPDTKSEADTQSDTSTPPQR
jgi:hypothetical protein